MRGRFWCGLHPTTLALLPLVLGGHARAAENDPEVITLSCDGMVTPTYGFNADEPECPFLTQSGHFGQRCLSVSDGGNHSC